MCSLHTGLTRPLYLQAGIPVALKHINVELFQCTELVNKFFKCMSWPYKTWTLHTGVANQRMRSQVSEEHLMTRSSCSHFSHIYLFPLIYVCFILLSGSTRNHQILHSERKKRVALISKPQYVWLLPEPLSCFIWIYNFNIF